MFDAVGNKQDHLTINSDKDQEDLLLELRYKFWKEKRTVLTWNSEYVDFGFDGDRNLISHQGPKTYHITIQYPQ